MQIVALIGAILILPLLVIFITPARMAGRVALALLLVSIPVTALLWLKTDACRGDGCIGIALLAMVMTISTLLHGAISILRWLIIRSRPTPVAADLQDEK
jgi:hypothetical protein